MRRARWPVVASVVLVGVLFLAVFPARTYLAQRRDLAATERRLAVLESQNKDLSARVERLNSDAEIERLAREQYNLVRPGEEAYAILPPPGSPPGGDEDAAARQDKRTGRGFWSDLWDTVTFWS
ncbi:MAG: septum formation initiator family protein [Actinomycetota bacterium]|nr:septum formation initiator family protein [Actinomycetota bacterium]